MAITPTVPDDNLPSPSISGQLPQAVARKSARRGGTPNAPEVDDEPAPAAAGPTAVSGGSTPQMIAANPDAGMSYGQSLRTAADAFLGGPSRMVGRALGVPSYQPQPAAPQAQAPAPPTPAPGQAIAANPNYGNEGRQPPVVAPPNMGAPGTYGPSDTGVRTAPTAYTAPGAAPSIAGAPAMTTDQANAFYGAQRRADQAKQTTDIEDARARSLDAAQKGEASLQADRITHGTELFHARNEALKGNRAAGRIAGQLSGQAATAENYARTPMAPRNLIGEQDVQSRSVAAEQAAGQALEQNRLTNPLHVQALQQGLAAGGTQQKIAELTLKGHETRQGIIDELGKTTDAERHLQLTNALLAMEGKPPQSPYKIHAVPGALGEPATGFVIDERTGNAHVIAGKENPIAKTGFGPHAEGTRLKGPDGKMYVVKNGQPVPE